MEKSLRTATAAIAASIALLSGCGRRQTTPQDDIAAAQDAVRQMLGNPVAARFRNDLVVGDGQARIVCGEVDGVNVAGVYVGFKPYAYAPTHQKAEVYVRPDPKAAEESAVAQPVFPSACER